MIDVLALPFMQRALLAAILSGLIAPTIGTYISIALPVVVFLSLQRYFVRGLLAGGTKG